jgi:hypothetical protein
MENRIGNSSRPLDNGLWIRVLILGVYCILVNLWIASHFGDEFLNVFIAPVALSFVGVVKFFADMLGGKVKDRLSGFIRASTERLASPPVLAFLWLAFLVVSSFVSSVTVLADGQAGPVRVLIGCEGDPTGMEDSKVLSGPNSTVRFVRLTTARKAVLHYSGWVSPLLLRSLRVERQHYTTDW